MSTKQEKVFRTDGGRDEAQQPVYDFPVRRIRDLSARIRKVTTTDEGKLQIVLEGEIIDSEELLKIRDLLLIQQGDVEVDISTRQGELPL